MTGTEGRARYRISSNGGTEFIDLWWDNPFVGGNKSSIAIVQDFTGKPSQAFEGANHIDGSPPPNLEKMSEGDVEAWIDAVLFPPYIVANASSANDATAVFAIREKAQVSSPLFGAQGSGPRSSRINTAQKPAEWEGLWANNAVSVSIFSHGGGSMSANITDTTANPILQFEEPFRLGQLGWAFNAFALGMHQELYTIADNKVSSSIIQAVGKTINVNREDRERVPSTFREVAETSLRERKLTVPETKLVRFSKAASAVAKMPRSSVMLSHGVCLTLYDDIENGRKVGSHMLYERLTSIIAGRILASERLTFYPMLH